MCSMIFASKSQEPILVKDINPFGDSRPSNLYSFDDVLFFSADDSIHGRELWKTDGTEEGTALIRDIWPGSESAWIAYLEELDGKLYFAANDSIHNQELWVSDGTESGTLLFMDIEPGGWGQPAHMTQYQGLLYFSASNQQCDELWVSDGTVNGTFQVKDIAPGNTCSSPSGFFGFNDMVYFTAENIEYGREPWVTDATTEGTSLVKDIYPGGHQSLHSSSKFTEFNGKFYFKASDGINEHGRELWISDGTPDGTYMLKDIKPGIQSAFESSSEFVSYNGLLYFSAHDGTHGYELWTTDGTSDGTVLFTDLRPGYYGSYPYHLTVYNDRLYFSAIKDTLLGSELFVSDGTIEGTMLFKDINPGPGHGNPRSFFSYNGFIYFTADDGSNGRELWITDGTEPGTYKIVPANAIEQDPLGIYNFNGFIEVNEVLYFTAKYDNYGTELYQIGYGTSIPEGKEKVSGFHVYPNPIQEKFYLDFNCTEPEIFTIEVHSMEGKMIVSLHETSYHTGNHHIVISLPENLKAGMYIINIHSGDEIWASKLIKR